MRERGNGEGRLKERCRGRLGWGKSHQRGISTKGRAERARDEDKKFCDSRGMRALFSGMGGDLHGVLRGAPEARTLGRNTFGSWERSGTPS